MSSVSFCPCTDFDCEFNPKNHNKGCTLCVEDSVKTREIPKCFFEKVTNDITNISDWSFEAFAKMVLDKE